MKKILLNRLLPLLLLSLSLLMPLLAFAGPVLVPEGCQEGCPCTLCDLYTLAKNFVDFLLYLTVPIATIMFAWGGISMIMAQGGDGVTKGRKAMAAAVIGMGLAFFAWIILNAIITTLAFGPVVGGNPTNWIETLSCPSVTGTENRCTTSFPTVPDGPSGPGPTGPGGGTSDAEVRSRLNPGIQINKTCQDPTKRYQDVPGGQTCLNGLDDSTIEKLNRLQADCGCVVITGGTELGHASHGPGNIVDLRFNANARDLLGAQGYPINANFGRGVTCESSPGVATDCYGGNVDHMHVEL